MGKTIIYIGIAIVVIGVILYYFPNTFKWFGKLPGDFRMEGENSKFYFPLTSMILISILLNVLLRVFKQLS